MKYFFTLTALFASLVVFSQDDNMNHEGHGRKDRDRNHHPVPRFGANLEFGASLLTNLPDGVDQQLSVLGRIGATARLPLGRSGHALSIGANVEGDRHIVDAQFTRAVNNGPYSFRQTPANFKSNEIWIYYVNVPVHYEYWRKGQSISVGPVFSYQLDARNKYKIGSSKMSERAPIENELKWGLSVDLFSLPPFMLSRNSVVPGLGVGAYYQVSDLVEDGTGFKPLSFYLRAGWAIR